MKRLRQMRDELSYMAEREAMKLWRIAKQAEKRNCSAELIRAIREEANWLNTYGYAYPERLLAWEFEYKFKYAFKM